MSLIGRTMREAQSMMPGFCLSFEVVGPDYRLIGVKDGLSVADVFARGDGPALIATRLTQAWKRAKETAAHG